MISVRFGKAYRLSKICCAVFLGDEEAVKVVRFDEARPSASAVLGSVIGSDLFDRAVRQPLEGRRAGDRTRFAGRPSTKLLEALVREFPTVPDAAGSARSWSHLLELLFGDSRFVASLPGSPGQYEVFRKSLRHWPVAFPQSTGGDQDFVPARDLHIIVPLYRQPDLLPGLFAALIESAQEITDMRGRIVVVNDSPDHDGLRVALDRHVPVLRDALDVRVLTNERNLGFVGSCNRAMRQAHEVGADILLLNSDAILTPGAIREMRIVAATDPMISVVSPRSNNATICNSPYPQHFRSLPLDEAYAAHLAIQHYLPRLSYVPVAVGFCLLIRYEMIDEFGVFDTIYGGGYNEENDLILRCNRRGYRAVLANHAFVFHIGSVSFESSSSPPAARETANRAILLSRYPDYVRSLDRFFDSAAYRAEFLLAGLAPAQSGKLRILFDARNIHPHHNGTFELARRVVEQFVSLHHHEFDIFIAISHSALMFHGFDRITWLTFCWNDEERMAPFAAVVRLAQPFQKSDMAATLALAPVSCFLMLDTIALDCQQLDDQDLGTVWNEMAKSCTSIGYISQFSADQFNKRFSVGKNVNQFVALCSTRVEDYGPAEQEKSASGEHILIVGNHYPHKHVSGMLSEICVDAHLPIVVLGTVLDDLPGVTYHQAGGLSQAVVDDLYDRASLVLFPSFYEGFGLPIMHALARRKPVICRDIPAAREIKDRSRYGHNIHLCASTREMARRVKQPITWDEARPCRYPEQSWSMAAEALGLALRRDIVAFDYAASVERARRRQMLSRPDVVVEVPSPQPAEQVDFEGRLAALTRPANGLEKRTRDQLTLSIDSRSLLQVQLTMLDTVSGLHVGGTLTLNATFDQQRGDVLPRDVLLWLVGFGCSILKVQRGAGSIAITATKVHDWSTFLKSDELTDAGFVNRIYHELLGRAPDPEGAAHHEASLADGQSRAWVIKSFLMSSERHLFVEKHVKSLKDIH